MDDHEWDGESYCCEDGCDGEAQHRRLVGYVAGDEVFEMYCCDHSICA
jgi:hypothetical protein